MIHFRANGAIDFCTIQVGDTHCDPQEDGKHFYHPGARVKPTILAYAVE